MVTHIISCADLHFKSLRGIKELEESLRDFINKCKQIVEKEGKEHVRIVVAGDIFDAKISITNESIIAVNNFFHELDNICKTIVVAGNHDFLMNNMDRKDSISTVFELSSFNNTIYLDKELNYKSGCYTDDDITWALWSSFDGFARPNIEIEKAKHPDSVVVGIIHGDINGSTTIINTVLNNGINPEVFEGCEFVIAGHIHKHQEIKEKGVRIVYCSSITQKNFGETVSGHGFVLWTKDEFDDWEYKLIEVNNCGRAYYKFAIHGIEDLENGEEILINK